MRTVEWDYENHQVRMIDQRQLPSELVVVAFSDYRQVAEAIRSMVVRGAPAIGAAAAFGLALAADRSTSAAVEAFRAEISNAAYELGQARPTAVNLSWALRRMQKHLESASTTVPELKLALLNEAQKLADEDVEINRRMAEYGADLIMDGDTLLHHCNTGALAAVDWGTALGVIRMAHEQGKRIHVLVDETRPRLQGMRLTAWELQQLGIPYSIISDNAAGFFLRSGQVQKVFFGADRIAANGDVANKIGTYMLALAAHDNNVPAYSVAPTSTIDLSLKRGDLIPIEERSASEVLDIQIAGQPAAPLGASARNPAFDVTPNRLISAIVTEYGVVYPPYFKNLKQIVPQEESHR